MTKTQSLSVRLRFIVKLNHTQDVVIHHFIAQTCVSSLNITIFYLLFLLLWLLLLDQAEEGNSNQSGEPDF